MRLERVPTLFVASDLDGTLLTSDHRITDRTRAAVDLLRSTGGVFVPATARPLRDAAPIAEAVGADFLLCSGGGVLYDPARRRVVGTRLFAADRVTALLSALRAAFPDIRLGIDYPDHCDLDPGFDLGAPGTADLVADAPLGSAAGPAVKLIAQSDLLGTDALAAAVRELFGTGPDAPAVAVSCQAFAEVLPAGVHKAGGLALLLDGPAAAAPTVAFGDMPADLPMLHWADTAVAVANAHPDVLTACHHVTAANDEDGVAAYLERLLDRPPSTG